MLRLETACKWTSSSKMFSVISQKKIVCSRSCFRTELLDKKLSETKLTVSNWKQNPNIQNVHKNADFSRTTQNMRKFSNAEKWNRLLIHFLGLVLLECLAIWYSFFFFFIIVYLSNLVLGKRVYPTKNCMFCIVLLKSVFFLTLCVWKVRFLFLLFFYWEDPLLKMFPPTESDLLWIIPIFSVQSLYHISVLLHMGISSKTEIWY